jgi:hypothetical protein
LSVQRGMGLAFGRAKVTAVASVLAKLVHRASTCQSRQALARCNLFPSLPVVVTGRRRTPCERGETKASGDVVDNPDPSTWPNLFGFCRASVVWAFVYCCVVSHAASYLIDALRYPGVITPC